MQMQQIVYVSKKTSSHFIEPVIMKKREVVGLDYCT